MRRNFVAQFIRLLKHWSCAVCSWCCHGEELGPLCDQCWLQALQFLVHLINLLSTLLICNGFTGIQKAAVNQTGSRPPNSDRNLFFSFFFGTSLALASALELLLGPNTELVIAAFSPSNLLQVPNSRRMTDVEFCGNFSCSWERISSGSRLFFVTFPWPATVLLIFKALISFAKLEPPLYRMFVSSSWAKCIIDVVSCLCSYRTHFETKYKN